MANEMEGARDWTGSAELDLSSDQFKALELSGTDKGVPRVDRCDAATDLVIGILQNKPKAGEAAQVRSWGVSKAISGAAVAVNDRVGTDANGKIVPKTVDGNLLCGIALSAAAGADEVIEVFMTIGAQRAA